MWQLYIREFQHTASEVDISAYPCHLSNCVCANCPISAGRLLQNAESASPVKKLFLIRSAASGLAVTLPNMDRMAGGELE